MKHTKHMKRKLLILIPALISVLSFSVLTVYAGGSSKNTTYTPRSQTSVAYYSDSFNSDIQNGVAEAGFFKTDSTKTYLLAVSTGQLSDVTVDYILLRYIDTKGMYRTQYLNPGEGTQVIGLTNNNYFQYDPVVVTPEIFYANNSCYGESGSRNASYSGIYQSDTKQNGGKAYLSYPDWARALIADYSPVDYDALSTDEKISRTDNLFDSYTTEYIRFRTVCDIQRVLELSFILSDDSNASSWNLNEWRLYTLPSEWSTSAEGATYSFDNSGLQYFFAPAVKNAYFNSAAKLTTFSYLSDRIGMSYENLTLTASSKAMEEAVGQEGGSGIIRFVTQESYVFAADWNYYYNALAQIHYTSSETKSTESILTQWDWVNNIMPHWLTYSWESRGQYNASFMEYYLYTETNKKESTNAETLNFKINISDEYGAGISSLMTALDNVHTAPFEALIADIYYKNDWGYTEHVSLPVISDAMIDYVIASDETKTTEGEEYKRICGLTGYEHSVISYAQDGTAILFHVDFPNFESLESITLTYNNPLDTTDTLIIESIEAYDQVSGKDRSGYYTVLNKESVSLDVPAGSTMLYQTKPDDNNSNISLDGASSAYTFEFEEAVYTGTTLENQTAVQDYTDYYLVTVKTADVTDAGTSEEAFMQFTYATTEGGEETTGEYSIAEGIKEFYGYVPGLVLDDGLLPSWMDPQDQLTVSWSNQNIHFNLKDVVSDTKYLKENYDKDTGGKQYDISYVTDKTTRPVLTYLEYASESKMWGVAGYSAVDASYSYYMRQGSTFSFLIYAEDVSRFTGVNVRLGNTVSDQWQIQSISIQTIESLNSPSVHVLDKGVSYDKAVYFKEYKTRTANVRDTLYTSGTSDLKCLVHRNETKTINLETTDVSGEVKERDYSDYFYSMPYAVASSDLGFDETSKTYQVSVQVAKDTNSGTTTDDSGSSNKFYFQLIFENGSSGYVLANQQLSADSFRSGQKESFYVYTNEDYGDLVAVRIIPDDISEDSDIMDKLNIQEIEVIRYNTNAVNKKYTISDVGWITTDYHDTGNVNGISGRSVEELSNTFNVSAESYVMKLEFAIAYDPYSDGCEQFQGDMWADLTYVNSSGETKTMNNIKVVALEYAFGRMTAETNSDSGRSNMSDTAWMFRGGTIDRFYVSLDDAVSLKSITLKGNPVTATALRIKGISVNIVGDTGLLYVNEDNEYQVDYDQEPELLVDQVKRSLNDDFVFQANTWTKYLFTFDTNSIEIDETGSTMVSSISRVPESINDTLNLYLYMTDDGKFPSEAGEYGVLEADITYSSASTGSTYSTKAGTFHEMYVDETTGKFYTAIEYESLDSKIKQHEFGKVLSATGISATYMSLLKDLEVTADAEYSGATFDHAVLQQVRNDTVIETYYVSFLGKNAASHLGISAATKKTSQSLRKNQVVTIAISEETQNNLLVAEEYDLAVSLLYRTATGSIDKVYTSPYVYLTDNGTLNLKAGEMYTLDFHEYLVDEIVGIRVVGVNELPATITGATVACYDTDETGESVLMDYYSIEEECVLSSESTDLDVTDDSIDTTETLKRVNMTFATELGSETVDSNGKVPIRLTVAYSDTRGFLKTETFEDITGIVTEGSFTEGGTAAVSFFLKGMEKIRYFQIEPYDDDEDNVASWNAETLYYEVPIDDVSRTIPLNKNIKETTGEDEPEKINTANIVTKVTVTGIGNTAQIAQNSALNLTCERETTLTIRADIIGTLDEYGYTFKAEKQEGDSLILLEAERTGKNGESFSWTVPEGTEAAVYILTVSSEESSSLSSVITVNVPKSETEKDE